MQSSTQRLFQHYLEPRCRNPSRLSKQTSRVQASSESAHILPPLKEFAESPRTRTHTANSSFLEENRPVVLVFCEGVLKFLVLPKYTLSTSTLLQGTNQLLLLFENIVSDSFFSLVEKLYRIRLLVKTIAFGFFFEIDRI